MNIYTDRSLSTDTKVDLAGSWNNFKDALGSTAGVGQLLNLLAIVGMALIAAAFLKWAWDRRKSGGMGGGGNGMMGALIVGFVLSAPGFIIPAVLGVLDLLINAIVNIWNKNAVKG